MGVSDEIRNKILKAIEAKDGNALELAVNLAFQAGLPNDLSDIFAETLLMPWHRRHEDLSSALQEMKAPNSVNALFQAALSHHAYLDHDEFFGLARKCAWALADIGTPEAKERLQELARYENGVIAGYAQKRLDHWQDELLRKGKSTGSL